MMRYARRPGEELVGTPVERVDLSEFFQKAKTVQIIRNNDGLETLYDHVAMRTPIEIGKGIDFSADNQTGVSTSSILEIVKMSDASYVAKTANSSYRIFILPKPGPLTLEESDAEIVSTLGSIVAGVRDKWRSLFGG